MIAGFVLMLFLFINHFLLLRCYQIIANLVSGELSTLVIEIEVGLLAIIPTLNAVVCVECRNDGYLQDH